MLYDLEGRWETISVSLASCEPFFSGLHRPEKARKNKNPMIPGFSENY
jgi:hypothetical protein